MSVRWWYPTRPGSGEFVRERIEEPDRFDPVSFRTIVQGDHRLVVACPADGFDPERLGLFLAETGIGPETLRKSASDPKFLASVLDFVMRDDATVKAFSDAAKLHPTNVAAAHQALCDPAWERDVP